MRPGNYAAASGRLQERVFVATHPPPMHFLSAQFGSGTFGDIQLRDVDNLIRRICVDQCPRAPKQRQDLVTPFLRLLLMR